MLVPDIFIILNKPDEMHRAEITICDKLQIKVAGCWPATHLPIVGAQPLKR